MWESRQRKGKGISQTAADQNAEFSGVILPYSSKMVGAERCLGNLRGSKEQSGKGRVSVRDKAHFSRTQQEADRVRALPLPLPLPLIPPEPTENRNLVSSLSMMGVILSMFVVLVLGTLQKMGPES